LGGSGDFGWLLSGNLAVGFGSMAGATVIEVIATLLTNNL
jgi:hypothetical protein